MCNFKLDDVFSDVFGVSATRVLDKLLEQGNSDFVIAPLLNKNCKASIDDIKAALDGELSLAQAEKFKLIREHLDNLEKLKDSLEQLILRLAEKYQSQIDLLMSVPGISNPFTAIRILAEIGADMSVFETAKKLCSWAGLSPQNNESANKKKTTRIARSGAYLKPLLVQIVLAIVKSNKHPEFRDKYLALKKRRGHKKALIAIARKLITAIWHMLSNGEFYNASLYHKADKLPANRVLTPEQAFALLRSKGFQILDIKPAVLELQPTG
jgi:transposase